MPRRFEFNEGNSSKFWEIEQSGTSLTTWWGRIGTSGQSNTKDFASDTQARIEYNKLVAEKTKKGYVEIGGPLPRQATAAVGITPQKSDTTATMHVGTKGGVGISPGASSSSDTAASTTSCAGVISGRGVSSAPGTNSPAPVTDTATDPLGWDDTIKRSCREMMAYIVLGVAPSLVASHFGISERVLSQLLVIQRAELGQPVDDLLGELGSTMADVPQMRKMYIATREELLWTSKVGLPTESDRKFLDYLLDHLINKKPIAKTQVIADMGSPGGLDFLCFYRHWVRISAQEQRRILNDLTMLGWAFNQPVLDQVREATRSRLQSVGLSPEPAQFHWSQETISNCFHVSMLLQMGFTIENVCDRFRLPIRDMTLIGIVIRPDLFPPTKLGDFQLAETVLSELKHDVFRMRAVNVMERNGSRPTDRDLYYIEREIEQEARGVEPAAALVTISMLSGDAAYASFLEQYAAALLQQKEILLEELLDLAAGDESITYRINSELQLLQIHSGQVRVLSCFVPGVLEELSADEREIIECIEEQSSENTDEKLTQIFQQLKQHIAGLVANFKPRYPFLFGPEIKIRELDAYKQIMAMGPDEQAKALSAILHEIQSVRSGLADYRRTLEELAGFLYKRNLPLNEVQFAALVNAVALDYPSNTFSASNLVAQVERFSAKHGCAAVLSAALKRLEKKIAKGQHHYSSGPDTEGAKLIHRMQLLVQRAQGEEPIPIAAEEAWSDQAIADLRLLDSDERKKWLALLDHCSRTTGTKPSGTWLKRANDLIKPIGEERFVTHIHRWFSLVPKKGSRTGEEQGWGADSSEVLLPQNVEILKGLAYCCTGRTDARLASALGDAAEASFKKVTNWGPRCPKLGTACVHSLSSMNTKDSIAQLTRVQARAKHSSVKTQIEKALSNAADKSGMTVDDLQDVGVPTFGMQHIGLLVSQIGTWRAELTIENADAPTIRWTSCAGKTQDSVPAEVKSAHATDLKALQKLESEISKLLPGLRHRIERSFMDQRHWTYESWKDRYLNHPLIATIARRLLWSFSGRTGIWFEGGFVDQNGETFEPAANDIVELWHPIAAEPAIVLHWRQWITQHQVVQPFKQCHREIYVLTDAERNTAMYSNRFAGHIVRQHQLQHLCMQRGWHYQLMGSYDFQSTPTLELPRWDMTVEYYVELPDDDQSVGVARNVATDKVQFLRKVRREASAEEQALIDEDPTGYLAKRIKKRLEGGRHDAIALTEILPVVFSEVMRDVDLFVGVCSIGADPNWNADAGFGQYWRDFSFGELSQSAETRKQVIEALLPSLKIAPRCKIDGKFLVVHGDLRTYKIHFGSGNILMEPNDQYLCIVAARGLTNTAERVFLPFEGDAILSLILSKAVMLADDTKIKDSSIVSQIKQAKQ